MRILWKGWLSFGLINVPINMYSGVRAKELSFHLLDSKDKSPIRFARICTKEGKEIPWEQICKGFELENGEMVIVTDEDFEKANLKRVKTIEILDFALEEEVDPILYQKPFYLEPQKGAAKAYTLLREGLKKSKKVGVCKFVLHNREHLGIIKADNEMLVLIQLHFANEIQKPALDLPKAEKLPSRELEMAVKLIDSLSTHFNPKKYKDEYTEELLALIKQKSKGHRVKAKGKPPFKTKPQDFMRLMKASLQRKARA